MQPDAGYEYPKDDWTHVVVVYNVNGVRKAYANGKLLREHKPRPQVVLP